MENSKVSIGPRALTYPNPVLVICSYDEEDKPNMMTASWVGICCSEPPCFAVAVRKQRKTFGNINSRKAFTVNVPSEKFVKETDFSGIFSGKEVNKFEKLNLTPIKSQYVNAPYISEFPLILECELIEQNDLGTHTQFIGKIVDIKTDSNLTNGSKLPEILDLKPFVYDSATKSYYKIGDVLAPAYRVGLELK